MSTNESPPASQSWDGKAVIPIHDLSRWIATLDQLIRTAKRRRPAGLNEQTDGYTIGVLAEIRHYLAAEAGLVVAINNRLAEDR